MQGRYMKPVRKVITPQFESSEEAQQSLESIQSLWTDVSTVLIKAGRWLLVEGEIDRDGEVRLRKQIDRMDRIVRALHDSTIELWREEYP